MYLKSLWILAFAATSGCAPSTDASIPDGSRIVSQCPAGSRHIAAGQEDCFGGDPAVLAALPGWAKPPEGVKIRSTAITRSKLVNAIGYRAEFHGPLSTIEQVYRAQLRSAPDMKPRYQGKILVADVPGNMNLMSLSLTEQSFGADKLVEINVAAGPVWKTGEPRPWVVED